MFCDVDRGDFTVERNRFLLDYRSIFVLLKDASLENLGNMMKKIMLQWMVVTANVQEE